MENQDRLAKRAANREDKYLQTISKARNEAEQAGDKKIVEKLDQIYDEATDKIENVDKERRQKVLDSHIWVLEQEIEVYDGAMNKIRDMVGEQR